MKFTTLLAIVLATAGLGYAATANAGAYSSYTSVLSGGTLIDFEGVAPETLVDTQYAGVTFSQTGGGRPIVDEFPWMFGYGGASGDQVLTGSTEGGNTFATLAGLTLAFDAGQSAVEFFLSDTAPLGDYPITFYGLGGSILGSFTLAGADILPPGYSGGIFPNPAAMPRPGIFVGFTSAGNDIYGIGIGPSTVGGDSYAIDDVRFSAGTTAVPEPATWALSILGFGVAGTAMRRRRVQAA